MTLQCIQPKIIEDTHKPQGCKHKEGGAGATLGCEIGHARVPAAAKGYGEGMGHQIGDVERKREGLWGIRHICQSCRLSVNGMEYRSRTIFPKIIDMFNKWKLLFYRCLLRKAQRAVTGSQQGTSFSLQAVINSLSPQLEFHYPIPLFSCMLRSPDLRDRHREGKEENTEEVKGDAARPNGEGSARCSALPLLSLR